MQLMILSFIDDWWNGFCSRALAGIASFFCKLVYSLENVYFYLLGTENIPNTQELNIFEQIFANQKTNDYLLIFFSVAGIIWLFCFLVSLIKGMANQDTPGAVKKAIINSVKAILGIVVIPFLCLIFFRVSLHLITYTVHALNGGSDTPIAAQIWEAGYNGYEPEVSMLPSGYSKFPFTFSYDSLSAIAFTGYTGNFFYVGHEVHFDYFIVIIGAAILSICMGIATIKLCGRLINIVILYIISPVVVSTISVDDGKRYEAWKEISLSKLFSIMGSVLGMYIYLVLLQVVSSARDSIIKEGGINIFIGIIFFLICAISGALMVIKGSDMLDSIVSQNSGGQDGLSPMGMASLGRVLGRGIGKAKTSLIGKPSAKGGNGGGSNSGGNGTFNNTGSTGAWGSFKSAMGNSPMGKALNSIRQNGLVGAGVNAVAGIGTGIKDNHQINQDLKDAGYQHPNFHPILKHEQKQAIKKDRQQLQNFKNQSVNKDDLKALKNNRLGSEEFRTRAIEIAKKYKENQENGVYR